MRLGPIGQTLAPGRFGTGGVGGAEDRDKDRGGVDFPRQGIQHGYGLAGAVHKECLASPVALSPDQIELSSPLALGLTKLAVPEAMRGLTLYACHNSSKVTPLCFRSWCTVAQAGVGRLATGVLAAVARSRLSRTISSRVSGRGQPGGLCPPHILGGCGAAHS